LPFAITVDGEFAGQLTVGNVIRGSLRSAWLGYWVDSSLTGGGVATAAVALVADHLFTAARIHRIEATVHPENAASLRVLAKADFRQEGLFKRYLHVNGAWQDHLYFALTAEEIGDGVVSRLIARGQASPE
jgi:ribosomal-protein-alanine N-acetyltransferase